MLKDRAYTITMACSVCWYLCVLGGWVWIGRSMHLFGNQSPQGWLYIFLAFAASAVLNFVLNPFLWVIAGCFISAAKEEGRVSKWSLYPNAIGVLLIAAFFVGVFSNTRQMKDIKFLRGMQTEREPSVDENGQVNLTVSGVMFAGEPSALVNGFVVKKGEHIDGYDVLSINENSVTFRDAQGNEFIQRVR
jgi:hypothetical protein